MTVARFASALVIALVTLGIPTRLAAWQAGNVSTFIAGVADAETGEGLEGAEVILVRLRRLTRANGMGEATFTEVPRGVQRVRVRRLGYAPAEVDLAIAGDTSGAVFRLQRRPTELGVVRVEAEWVPPRMKDVEARRRQGIGRFLTERDLERDKDRDFVLAMTTRFPGLHSDSDETGRRALVTKRSAVSIAGGAPPCYVAVYLDDVEQPREADLIRTWDLAVVEFYSAEQVPVRYRTKHYGCGVLLLWSKWY